MSASFTSGPWAARPDANSSCEWEVIKTDARKTSISQDPWFICLCMDDADGASAEANARLIAAAPDMHAALVRAEQAVQDLCYDQDPANECWVILGEIRAALAKSGAAA